MATCQICKREFTKLNAPHVKTHGLTMDEYYQQYDKEKHREQILLKFFKEHYITIKYRYIKYISDKLTCTVDTRAKTEKRRFPLSDTDIRAHIRGDYTIGIYFPSEYTKFIGLDLDVKDIDMLSSVFTALWNFGFSRENILMSSSGGKGYHIDIFLDRIIKKTVVSKFYEMLLKELGMTNSELEVRGAGAQGYKLPLGYHVKTGNYCFACDENGQELDDLETVQGIIKANADLVFDSLNMNYDLLVNESEIIEKEEFMISVPHTTLYENKGRRRKIEQILIYGLSEKGNRNNTCFEVALYYKTVENYCLADTLNRMTKWICDTWDSGAEPMSFLQSGELETVIKKAYKNPNYKFGAKYEDIIQFTEPQITEIFTITDSNGRKQESLRRLYFIMAIHSKGYSGINGTFYMTYEQIRNLGLKNRNSFLKQQIDELIELGKVERYDPAEERMKNGNIPPYNYKLPLFQQVLDQGTKSFICERTARCKDCIYITYGCLVNGAGVPEGSDCNGKLIVL